jgi:ankyrin repeat protein
MNNYKDTLFKLLHNNKINEFYDIIKKDNTIDLDIKDTNNIYIIQYLINYNNIEIIKYIFEHFQIRIDIINSDGRNILYYLIVHNFNKMFDFILQKDKTNIGISIIDLRDNLGYTSLHYTIIFNNFYCFQQLYKNNCDIYIINNEKKNIFELCLKHNTNDILLYLIENEFKKNNYNFTNINNETLFMLALTFKNNIILDYLINVSNYMKYIINKQEKQYGLTILHQLVITKKNKYINKLFEYNVDYNISDKIGNYCYHYAVIENNYQFLKFILDKDINYNNTNINGNTLLHLFLLNESNIFNNEKYDFVIKMITNTNLNIQNNEGVTCLHLIINKQLYTDEKIYSILINGTKNINLFIMDNNNNTIYDKLNDKLINMTIDAYYNKLLKLNSDKLIIEWEKYCSSQNLEKVIKVLNKNSGQDIEIYCKNKIKKIILEEKRSIPKYEEILFTIDDIVFENNYFYTGSTIDILFGLIYLHNNFKNINFIIDYPLSQNNKLINYYEKIGLDYDYKIEFINIEILWSYQKLIYITNFDSLLINLISKDERFIIIPLGIEITEGSHANIIIFDKINKIIERFEPNGAYTPYNFNYNSKLLDSLLKNKFINLLNEYTYITPSDYLPIIGFQMLENINMKNIEIGDPNGFCAVWCIWWCKYKISNPNIESKKLAIELIKNIKLSNKSFKKIIRNFSKNIVILRDDILKKYNIDINDWINNNYTQDIIDNIEKDIISLF